MLSADCLCNIALYTDPYTTAEILTLNEHTIHVLYSGWLWKQKSVVVRKGLLLDDTMVNSWFAYNKFICNQGWPSKLSCCKVDSGSVSIEHLGDNALCVSDRSRDTRVYMLLNVNGESKATIYVHHHLEEDIFPIFEVINPHLRIVDVSIIPHISSKRNHDNLGASYIILLLREDGNVYKGNLTYAVSIGPLNRRMPNINLSLSDMEIVANDAINFCCDGSSVLLRNGTVMNLSAAHDGTMLCDVVAIIHSKYGFSPRKNGFLAIKRSGEVYYIIGTRVSHNIKNEPPFMIDIGYSYMGKTVCFTSEDEYIEASVDYDGKLQLRTPQRLIKYTGCIDCYDPLKPTRGNIIYVRHNR